MEDGLDERLRTVVHGAIGALPRKLRDQAEQQLQAATLEKLTEAMAAWIYGSKMDGVSFAHHFFDRDADDPVVGSFAGGGIGDGGRRDATATGESPGGSGGCHEGDRAGSLATVRCGCAEACA